MDNDCEFNHEGFCTLEKGECSFQEGDLLWCKATDKDLIEICPDCDKPITECECGTNWVLVHTKDGKIIPVISKEYYEKVIP